MVFTRKNKKLFDDHNFWAFNLIKKIEFHQIDLS